MPAFCLELVEIRKSTCSFQEEKVCFGRADDSSSWPLWEATKVKLEVLFKQSFFAAQK